MKEASRDTLYCEQLLCDKENWRDCPAIIKSTFQAVIDVLKSNCVGLHETEQILSSKISREEFQSATSDKVSLVEFQSNLDHLRTSVDSKLSLLDNKVSLPDVQKLLIQKPSYDDTSAIVQEKALKIKEDLSNLTRNVNNLQKLVEKKADLADMNKKIDSKDMQKIESKLDSFEQLKQHFLGKINRKFKEFSDKFAIKSKEEKPNTQEKYKKLKKTLDSKLVKKADAWQLEEMARQLREELIDGVSIAKNELKVLQSKSKEEFITKLYEKQSVVDKIDYDMRLINDQIDYIKNAYIKSWENYESDYTYHIKITDELKNMMESLQNLSREKEDKEHVRSLLKEKASIQEVEELLISKNRELTDTLHGLSLDFRTRIDTVRDQLEYNIESNLSMRIDQTLLSDQEKSQEMTSLKLMVESAESQLQELMNQDEKLKEITHSISEKADLQALDSKVDKDTYMQFAKESNIVLNTLCSEICLGRWIWKSKNLVRKDLVPWDIESINTNPHNFLWERACTFIMIEEPGIYECSISIFSNVEVPYKVLLNGEQIFTVSRPPHVKYCPAANYKKPRSLVEFFKLPKRARLSVSTSQPASGFISLKKL